MCSSCSRAKSWRNGRQILVCFSVDHIMAEPVHGDEVLGAQGQTNTGMGCNRASPKCAHSRV